MAARVVVVAFASAVLLHRTAIPTTTSTGKHSSYSLFHSRALGFVCNILEPPCSSYGRCISWRANADGANKCAREQMFGMVAPHFCDPFFFTLLRSFLSGDIRELCPILCCARSRPMVFAAVTQHGGFFQMGAWPLQAKSR